MNDVDFEHRIRVFNTLIDRGGIETLFSDQKKMVMHSTASSLKDLILELADQCSKKELFLKDNTVYVIAANYRRPGILVLVNDADWELLGLEDYNLSNNDQITFISTLHGG